MPKNKKEAQKNKKNESPVQVKSEIETKPRPAASSAAAIVFVKKEKAEILPAPAPKTIDPQLLKKTLTSIRASFDKFPKMTNATLAKFVRQHSADPTTVAPVIEMVASFADENLLTAVKVLNTVIYSAAPATPLAEKAADAWSVLIEKLAAQDVFSALQQARVNAMTSPPHSRFNKICIEKWKLFADRAAAENPEKALNDAEIGLISARSFAKDSPFHKGSESERHLELAERARDRAKLRKLSPQ